MNLNAELTALKTVRAEAWKLQATYLRKSHFASEDWVFDVISDGYFEVISKGEKLIVL